MFLILVVLVIVYAWTYTKERKVETEESKWMKIFEDEGLVLG